MSEQPDESAEKGEAIGAGSRQLLRSINSFIGGLTAGFMSTAAPIIPFRQRLFKRMALKSLENYYRLSGGDAIAIVEEPGQRISLSPVKYRAPEECEEGEKPGWKEKDKDKVWEAGGEGYDANYYGRTPLIAVSRDQSVEAGFLSPRIANAIELDRYDGVYQNPQISAHFDVDPTMQGGQAIADGGYDTQFAGLSIDNVGRYAGDQIVDLSSPDGYDGMRISFKKAAEWQAETTTTETMQMQEDRGYIMGLKKGDAGPSVLKLLVVCAAIILGTLAMIFVVPQMLGGEAVTEMNPLLVQFASHAIEGV